MIVNNNVDEFQEVMNAMERGAADDEKSRPVAERASIVLYA